MEAGEGDGQAAGPGARVSEPFPRGGRPAVPPRPPARRSPEATLPLGPCPAASGERPPEEAGRPRARPSCGVSRAFKPSCHLATDCLPHAPSSNS